MSVNINSFDAFNSFLKLFSKNVVNNDKIVYVTAELEKRPNLN